MRLLGIDFGTKRIGVALSDDGARIAFPHITVENNKKTLEEFKEIVDEYEVGEFIIGESKNYKMKDNPVMEDAREFADLLEEEFPNIPVKFHNEVLTSVEVSKTHFQATKEEGRNMKEKDKVKNIDARAASIMLQSYIDFK